MKQGYNNPIVTYDEIVEALNSIIECSLNNNYDDEFGYLNIKYETGTKNKIDAIEERALYTAIKQLQKSIDSSSKMIKSSLERELIDIEKSIFKIHTEYLIGQEKRKLSAQKLFVDKLRNASLNLDVLYRAPQFEEQEEIIALDSLSSVDTNRIFSDFERRAISNFPDYFREELEIANQEFDIIENEEDDDYIDVTDLFSTLKLEPGENNEDVEISDFINFRNEERILLLKRALKKAKILGNTNLVIKLEEQLNKELNR